MAKKKTPPPEVDPLERYRGLLDAGSFAALLEELRRPLPQALRLNPLKLDPAEAISELAGRYDWQLAPVPFCPSGWQVLAAGRAPSQTVEFRMGAYYIQDAASMLPAELFDLAGWENPLLLDMAAAPGGKTTHLVSRAGDRGLVIGNDSSPGRISALRGVLRDWGALNWAVTAYPGDRFGGWYPETFDGVLLDAPCSMENLRSGGAHARRYTSARERSELAGRQLRLLAGALQAVKTGGQIVYSTCTLAPEEDEAVLDGLLKRYPGAVRVEDAGSVLARPAPGLDADETTRFDPAVRSGVRLWPHLFGTSGFFAARLVKTAPVETARQDPPTRPIEKAGWQRLAAKELRGLSLFFNDEYGFDLERVMQRQGLSAWRRGEGVYLLPELLFSRFPGLPVEGAGLLLGEDAALGFELSHEWAARFWRDFGGGVVFLLDDQLPAWLRGEDLLRAGGDGWKAGQVLLVGDQAGRFLGRGRVQAQRLKNLLPRRLVSNA